MTWSIVGSAGTLLVSSTSPATLNCGQASTPGNLLIAVVNTTTNVAPTMPGGWTLVASNTALANDASFIYANFNCPSISSISVTFPATLNAQIIEYTCPNVALLAAADQTGSVNNSSPATPLNITSGFLTANNELAVATGSMRVTSAITSTLTAGAGFTQDAQVGNGVSQAYHRTFDHNLDTGASSGTQVTDAVAFTATSAGNQVGVIATFAQPSPAAGGAVQALPGQTWLRQFHHRQQPPQAVTLAAAAPAVAPVFPAPPSGRPARHRASLGARGLLAAGILATGIGPPAVPAPHQPPAIAHPAPHRAQWRTGQGRAPNAAQQVKAPVPVTVYARPAHRAQWRSGTGRPPNAAQQVKIPLTVYRRAVHGASWRSGRGSPPAALPQPYKPGPIAHPVPHRAQWRGGAGTAVSAVLGTGLPQPFTPKTVYSRAPHRAQWRTVAGTAPVVAPSLGAAQPFRPVTVFARKAHGAIWKTVTGRPPAPAAQPFRPVTVYRRQPHAGIWRAVTGRPPAAQRQPFRPATVFTRLRQRALWRAGLGSPAAPPPPFTIGALTAADAPGSVLTAAGSASALTAATAPQGALTAATGAAAGTAAEYPPVYAPVYGTPLSGTLTAADTRTGGPG